MPGDPATVTVPDLIGLTVDHARLVGREAGVVVVSADLDGPQVETVALARTMVVAQVPVPGTDVPQGDLVRITWIDVGGGGGPDAGDREPRVPPPGGQSMWTSASAGEHGYEMGE